MNKKTLLISLTLLLVGSSPLLGQQLGHPLLEGYNQTLVRAYFLPDGSATSATLGTSPEYIMFTSLGGWPNATRYYEDAAKIENNDTVSHNIELSFDSWSGSTSSVNAMRVKVFDGSDTQLGNTIEVGTAESSTGRIRIPAGVAWRVQLEILWNAEASDKDAVDVTLRLDVA